MPNFKIDLLEEASTFLENLDEKTKEKIFYNMRKSQIVNDDELFKKLNEFIWEFRTLYSGKAYRLFAFWDKTTENDVVVIGTHAILKKTQKTPLKEIKKTEEIRKQYLANKENT